MVGFTVRWFGKYGNQFKPGSFLLKQFTTTPLILFRVTLCSGNQFEFEDFN